MAFGGPDSGMGQARDNEPAEQVLNNGEDQLGERRRGGQSRSPGRMGGGHGNEDRIRGRDRVKTFPRARYVELASTSTINSHSIMKQNARSGTRPSVPLSHSNVSPASCHLVDTNN